MTAGCLVVDSKAAGQDADPDAIAAGVAEGIITPPAVGTRLIGPMRDSTGVNDDLFARALVLSDGRTRLAIVTLDYLGLDFEFNDRIVAEISRRTGIPAPQIMVNCSHTHNAPMTIPWQDWESRKDKPWHAALPGQISDVVQRALEKSQPAQLRFQREPTQVGMNRRCPTEDGIVMSPNPNGPIVPWTDVVCLETPTGDVFGVLFSHAAHPVIVHGASTLITADYPGFAAAHIRGQLRKEAVALFAQGCGADINGFPLQGGIDAARAAGRDLGSAVMRAARRAAGPLAVSRLKHAGSEFTLPLQAPPPVAECERLTAKSPGNGYLKELLEIAKTGKPQTMRFPIQAFAMGEFCLVGLPHELFAEYQLHITRSSPFAHTLVLAYTNGCECYVGTEKEYALGSRGGYEIAPMGAALLYHRRLALSPTVEGIIKDGVAQVLKNLKAV